MLSLNNFEKAFPVSICDAVQRVVAKLSGQTYNNCQAVSDTVITYLLHGCEIHIPYRVYLIEITDSKVLAMDGIERLIVHCIFSRSSHGGVREKHVKALLSAELLYWVIPYLVKICDEYVVNILRMVYENLRAINTNDIKQFCADNPVAFLKSYNRMVSYWNEYHRRDNPNFQDYVGRKLFVECFGYRSYKNEK